ncbi:MAG: DUF262 domain-containing protein [Lachnospiraceae bacterium]|nr:DUF262 domain-containing protein [Lachnospiraceae bacterium]
MAVHSVDHDLSELLTWVGNGKAQLPDFQRSWVWDDTKICKLIESISSGFPMGAAMFLETGNSGVRFKYRPLEGVTETNLHTPDFLILDGQQRLTTLYQVFKSQEPVITRSDTNKTKPILRHYYIDIRKALDQTEDRLQAIISINEKKQLTEEIGRKVTLDLSTREQEFKELMYPLNIALDLSASSDWMLELNDYYAGDASIRALFKEFSQQVLRNIQSYKIPIINVTKDTSKEAVCQIFENVNTGGVKLTVFELVTATFAADEFNLRDDWSDIQTIFKSTKQADILRVVENTNFLTAMALLISYRQYMNGNGAVTCKKRDVLKMNVNDYKANRDLLVSGFIKAASFLINQGVFSAQNLPYTSQLVPLAAIFAYAEDKGINLSIQTNKDILAHWYWCGVFGELYGGANESRYASDIVDVFNQINGGEQPDTVVRANFQPRRLLSMQTRNSAAYKGVIALILQDSPLDFMSANKMDIATYLDESTDIHHIFPQNYCEQQGYDSLKWNSVINKTPIYASTNRSIGGRAPSEYIGTMANKGLTDEQIAEAISSHKIDYAFLKADDFDDFIIDRAVKLLDRIEVAMGKAVSGRDSEDTIKAFGTPLIG